MTSVVGKPGPSIRCKAKSKRTGFQCRNAPIKGATVCRMHGGRIPQVAAKAAVTAKQAEMRRYLAKTYPEHPDPLSWLLRTASEIEDWTRILREQVIDLDTFGYANVAAGEQIRAVVKLYTEALAQSVKCGSDLIRLDIENRLTRVEEAKVLVIADIIRRVLDRHRVDPIVLAEIATELAQVTA